jgi:hypothetical protein
MNQESRKESRYPIVKVTWVDAHSNASWFSKKQALEWAEDQNAYNCENVGYLISKTKLGVVLAARISLDGDMGLLQRIPYVWVKDIKTLKK